MGARGIRNGMKKDPDYTIEKEKVSVSEHRRLCIMAGKWLVRRQTILVALILLLSCAHKRASLQTRSGGTLGQAYLSR